MTDMQAAIGIARARRPKANADAPDEECHHHVPEDQGRRGDKRYSDEPEHVDQRGARDGIGNRPATSSAAAVRSCPVMAITCTCEPALAAIT